MTREQMIAELRANRAPASPGPSREQMIAALRATKAPTPVSINLERALEPQKYTPEVPQSMQAQGSIPIDNMSSIMTPERLRPRGAYPSLPPTEGIEKSWDPMDVALLGAGPISNLAKAGTSKVAPTLRSLLSSESSLIGRGAAPVFEQPLNWARTGVAPASSAPAAAAGRSLIDDVAGTIGGTHGQSALNLARRFKSSPAEVSAKRVAKEDLAREALLSTPPKSGVPLQEAPYAASRTSVRPNEELVNALRAAEAPGPELETLPSVSPAKTPRNFNEPTFTDEPVQLETLPTGPAPRSGASARLDELLAQEAADSTPVELDLAQALKARKPKK